MDNVCSVEDCLKKVRAKNMCMSHYMRFSRYGSPLGGRKTYAGDTSKWILAHLDYAGDDCIIWPYGRDAYGYGKIGIDRRDEYVHHVILTIIDGPKPTPSHEVGHTCGRGHDGCVNPRHLRFVTRHENIMDKVDHGTSNRGEQHYLSKLTEEDVRAILIDERSYSGIAIAYGVANGTVAAIKTGRSWQWLTGISPA